MRGSEHTEYLPGVYERRGRRTDPCRVLFGATESFGAALWDIPLEIARIPSKPEIEYSKRLVRRLVTRGWVVLLVEEADEPERELSPEDALQVIERREAWTASAVMVSIAATEAGQAAYATHAKHRPAHRVGFNY